MLIFSLLIILGHAGKLVEYRFGYNFGTTFKDFSENGRDGTTTGGTGIICTDRGVYFTGIKKTISIPSFTLPDVMWIIIWLISKWNGQIYFHGPINSNFLSLSVSDGSLFCANTMTTSSTSLGSGLERYRWELVVIKKNLNKYSLENSARLSTSDMTYNSGFESIGIGGNSKKIDFKGFVWYFLMTDETFTKSNYIQTGGSYSKIGNPGSCSMTFLDPVYGAVCISGQIDPGRDSFSQTCASPGTGCSGTFSYSCTCSEYCFYEIQTKTSSCSVPSTTPSCTAPYEDRKGNCCMKICASCEDFISCKTCIDPNAEVSGSTCVCSTGFYGSPSESLTSGCYACMENCIACPSLESCTTCKDIFVKVNETCVCPNGYYLDDSSVVDMSCVLCGIGCDVCNNLTCLSCSSIDFEIDLVDCKCKEGFYNSDLTNRALVCVRCISDCVECISESQCLKCKDPFASPVGGVCTCNSGFKGTPSISTTPGCQAICGEGCLECLTSMSCNKCIDPNSFIFISNCKCNDGFYWNPSNNLYCSPCSDLCMSCKDSTTCISCFDPNAQVLNGQCICKNNFFGTPAGKTSAFGCLSCLEDCETCENDSTCLTCKEDGAQIVSGKCECKEGFYKNEESSSLNCRPCLEECDTCSDGKSCLTCKALNSEINGFGCQCLNGFYNETLISLQESCLPCDSLCEVCDSLDICRRCRGRFTEIKDMKCQCIKGFFKVEYDSQDCVPCVNRSSSEECENICPASTFLQNGKCKPCSLFCLQCNSTDFCESCENFTRTLSGKCACPKGQQVSSKSCKDKYFEGSLKVLENNSILLKFSEKTEFLLKEEIFSLIFLNKSHSIRVKSENMLNYSITLIEKINFPASVPFKLTLLSPIFSNKDSKLKTYQFEDTFFKTPFTIFEETVETTVKTAVTLSFAAGIISNPGACWVLINTIQIIVYMPLANLNFSPEVLQFLQAISGYSVIPNLFSKVFDEDTTSKPIWRARRAGIDSTVFWINIGPNAVLFVFYLALVPFALIGTKIPYLSEKCYNFLRKYRYAFFIRFWIQVFLDFGIFALIQINSVSFMQSIQEEQQGYFNFITACVLIMIVGISPVTVLILLTKHRKNLEDFKVKEKFGSLFEEFKNDKGFFSCLYYFFFLIRRFQYMMTQVFLGFTPRTQLGMNIAFSFIHFFYLAYYRPFKSKLVLFTDFIGEICIIFLFIESVCFLPEVNLGSSTIDQVFIVVVIIAISFQTLANMIGLGMKIVEIYKKCQNYRAQKIIKRSNKVHPEKHTHVGESLEVNFENQGHGTFKWSRKVHPEKNTYGENSFEMNPGNTAPQETIKDEE